MIKLLLTVSLLVSLTLPMIPEPDLEWVPCRCNDATLGLEYDDYIRLQMFLSAVRNSCTRETTDLLPRNEDQNGIQIYPSSFP